MGARRPKDISQVNAEDIKRVNKLTRFVQSALQVCACDYLPTSGHVREPIKLQLGTVLQSIHSHHGNGDVISVLSITKLQLRVGVPAFYSFVVSQVLTEMPPSLQYDDVPTAVKNLEEALALLTH